MAVVDYDEQKRRERAAGGTFAVIFLALVLGAPVLGWIGAFFAAIWMAVKAHTNSANRPVDISIALGGLIPYYLIAIRSRGCGS